MTRNGMLARAAAAALALAVTAGGIAAVHGERRARADAAAGARALARVRADAAAREQDIALYERAVTLDTASALLRAPLAALYLQRARETGDEADYHRAEAVAREALRRNTQHNGRSFVILANALLAQHRFAEAAAVARQLAAGEPDVPQYQALLGEAMLELGDYDAARAAFERVLTEQASPSVAPRLARWAEINGRPDEARRLVRMARAAAATRGDLPVEQQAWFALRLGDLELRAGRVRQAERLFGDGLAVRPGDPRLLAALARAAAARGDWRDAVTHGERAIAVALDPATLGLLSDAYAALGDSARSTEYAEAMQVAASGTPGSYHRAWGLFLLDRGRNVAQVLRDAERDLEQRDDIHGWDLYAWALLKNGRPVEARRAMARALRTGTRDATILFHAGMIERAAGDQAAARRWLSAALAENPAFHPTQAPVARAAIAALGKAS